MACLGTSAASRLARADEQVSWHGVRADEALVVRVQQDVVQDYDGAAEVGESSSPKVWGRPPGTHCAPLGMVPCLPLLLLSGPFADGLLPLLHPARAHASVTAAASAKGNVFTRVNPARILRPLTIGLPCSGIARLQLGLGPYRLWEFDADGHLEEADRHLEKLAERDDW